MAEIEDDSELSFQDEMLIDIAEHLRSIRRSVWWIAFVILGVLVLWLIGFLAVVFGSTVTIG